jgi:FKBP-type peptidyl-prolyl cis-trans isomerase 2
MPVAEDDEGNERSVRVHEVRADGVVLDMNHPLAGQVLNFAVRIVAIE